MEVFVAFLCALIIGGVAGLRSMLAPAAVSWAAWLGILHVEDTPLAFMGYRYTHLILTACALGELVADKTSFIPSRKSPPSFIFRIISGAVCGATIGASVHGLVLGLVLGAAGAVAGTLVGYAARAKLAAAFGRDLPAALLEDVSALVIICLCLLALK